MATNPDAGDASSAKALTVIVGGYSAHDRPPHQAQLDQKLPSSLL